MVENQSERYENDGKKGHIDWEHAVELVCGLAKLAGIGALTWLAGKAMSSGYDMNLSYKSASLSLVKSSS